MLYYVYIKEYQVPHIICSVQNHSSSFIFKFALPLMEALNIYSSIFPFNKKLTILSRMCII